MTPVPDYRRFLTSATPAAEPVLPYFGGPFVEAADRRLRVVAEVPPAPGFWRFEVRGRSARPLAPADPPDLSSHATVRGYSLPSHAPASYVVGTDARAQRLAIGPPDEPLLFAPLVARRWPTGELVFDTMDFETGIEDRVRHAYQQRATLRGLAGVPAALRAAFGYAVLLRRAEEQGIPARPAEARAHLAELCSEGDRATLRVLRRMVAARRAGAGRTGVAMPLASPRPAERAVEHAAEALRVAGATLCGARQLDGGLLELRYDFLGEQFVSVVYATNLQVVDAGICLSGEDRALTLESLPPVLREAMDSGQLHMTAW